METDTEITELKNAQKKVTLEFFKSMKDGDSFSVPGLDEAFYHSIDRVSKHTLDEFAKNPYAFARRIAEKREPEAPSAAMRLGSAIHAALLTPEIFEEKFVTMPESIKTRRGKAWDEFLANNAGKEILSLDEVDAVNGVLARQKDTGLDQLDCIRLDDREKSIFWNEDGIAFKARIDAMDYESGEIIDIKTTKDASPDAFARSCDEFGYAIQGAMYLRAAKAFEKKKFSKFKIIAVETSFPFSVGIYTWGEESDFIRAGAKELDRRIAEYAAWKTGLFEAPTQWNVEDLQLPPWSKILKNLNS